MSKTARLEARITPDLQTLLKRAAELEGRTVTDFVIAAAQEAAERRVEQAHVIRLSLEDQRAFADAILNPPEPTAALRRAFRRRNDLISAPGGGAATSSLNLWLNTIAPHFPAARRRSTAISGNRRRKT
jgi:uncharacterized protein (DUF1778 family)